MEREREITLSTQWNYIGMKTVLAERMSGVGWSGSGPESRVIRRRSTSRSEKPFGACCRRYRRCRTE